MMERKKLFESEKIGFFRRLYLKWNFEWKYIPHNIKNGLRNFWYWKSIIWNDRDYDFTFTLDILSHKLSSVRGRILYKKYYLGYERDVEKINLMLKLIDSLKSQYYYEEIYKYFDIEIYEKEEDDRGFVTIETEIIDKNIDEYFSNHRRLYERVTENKHDEPYSTNEKVKIAREISLIRYNKAKRLLFELLNRNIERIGY